MFTFLFILGVITLLVWLVGAAAGLPGELVAVSRIICLICLIAILVLAVVSFAGRPHFAGVWW